MNFREAIIALPLFALLVGETVQADTASFATSDLINSGNLEFSFLPNQPSSRIHLNVTPAKNTKKERSFAAPDSDGSSSATYLKSLIGLAEAGPHGYDAVQYGAKVKPSALPTQMTIGEIYQWIDDTPRQQHAIGRYQFIPLTLRNLVHELGLSHDTRFTPQVQDRLADILLEDAGFSAFLKGKISRHQFMENLARIWAGFPTSTGRSYYHGNSGNRAVITWNEFDAHISNIFSRNNS